MVMANTDETPRAGPLTRETLEEREGRLRILMEAAFDGVVITENGVIIDASDRLFEASGFTREEIIGRSVLQLVAEEHRPMVAERQAAGFEGTIDLVGVFRDGRRRRFEAVVRNHTIAGRAVRIAALRDVTEQRQHDEQLRQLQKMEALGQLASSVAHDFNNVLTVIRSYAGILLEDLDEPQRSDALEILKASDLGAALTRQLLAYSRKQGTKLTAVDVNAVVQESEQLLKRLVGARIELATDLAPGAAVISADSSQLQQVMFNLAVNARDAMPDGGRLVVRTRVIELAEHELRNYTPARAGRYVMLSVSDSGTGIPAEVQAHMFEAFFTTKEPGRGTGLGLAVVKDIVEQSRGFIVVDSTLAVGTTFAIYLPVENG